MAEAKSPGVRHIACAVRGRMANRNAVRRAIELALEHEARLTFLLIMPDDFLAAAAPSLSPVSALRKRLSEIGEYILELLRDRAIARGVAEVECVIRIGDVRRNLRQFAQETTAQILVMGRPAESEPRSVFTPGEFDGFVAELNQIADLAVDVVAPYPEVN